MQHFNNLFAPRRWWELVPDVDHAVVTDGIGEFRGLDTCTTAIAPDGRLAIGYLPSARTITVDFGVFADTGPVEVTWFDPITGATTAAGTFEATGNTAADATRRPGLGDRFRAVLDGRMIA